MIGAVVACLADSGQLCRLFAFYSAFKNHRAHIIPAHEHWPGLDTHAHAHRSCRRRGSRSRCRGSPLCCQMVRSPDAKSDKEPPPGGGEGDPAAGGHESSAAIIKGSANGGVAVSAVAEPAVAGVATTASDNRGTTTTTAAPVSFVRDNEQQLDKNQSSALAASTTATTQGSGGGGGDPGGGGAAASSCMPRNFRLSLDGYTLQTDQDGTYAAYNISVTAGLHTWLVLRRYVWVCWCGYD